MGPPGRPPAARAGAGQEVPYSRRLLLKSLLRAIALASYTPSSGPRPQVCSPLHMLGFIGLGAANMRLLSAAQATCCAASSGVRHQARGCVCNPSSEALRLCGVWAAWLLLSLETSGWQQQGQVLWRLTASPAGWLAAH